MADGDRPIGSDASRAGRTGEMTPEEAVKAAEARIKPIFDTWRGQGKL